MNKRANMFFGVVIALIVWISGILIIPYIVDDIDTFRVDMDCSDSTISDSSKIVCLFGDVTIPYFIWTLVSLALGFLVGGRT